MFCCYNKGGRAKWALKICYEERRYFSHVNYFLFGCVPAMHCNESLDFSNREYIFFTISPTNVKDELSAKSASLSYTLDFVKDLEKQTSQQRVSQLLKYKQSV